MDLTRRFSSDLTASVGGATGGGSSGGNSGNNNSVATSSDLSNLCVLHAKELTVWCLECKEQICSDCVTKREKMGHSDHFIMPLADKINCDVSKLQ